MGGTFSIWHLLILGAVILILFGGKGKISDIMGDVAKGIKSFKKGLADDDKPTTQAIDHRPGVEASKVSDTQKAG
ncbi:MAG TPA: twin-arginine translocase TatA/TatE family subunit [Methylovirgula sp.]|nr:twin-arginine translocase TatA/TatE family subunit [Methylovirgula sp.]